MTCASLLFASAPLVGYVLANEKTLLMTETYSVVEKEMAQALNEFMVLGIVTLTSFSSGAAQHYLGWVMVNLLVVPFLVLVLIANLWLRRKPLRVDPETKLQL